MCIYIYVYEHGQSGTYNYELARGTSWNEP